MDFREEFQSLLQELVPDVIKPKEMAKICKMSAAMVYGWKRGDNNFKPSIPKAQDAIYAIRRFIEENQGTKVDVTVEKTGEANAIVVFSPEKQTLFDLAKKKTDLEKQYWDLDQQAKEIIEKGTQIKEEMDLIDEAMVALRKVYK